MSKRLYFHTPKAYSLLAVYSLLVFAIPVAVKADEQSVNMPDSINLTMASNSEVVQNEQLHAWFTVTQKPGFKTGYQSEIENTDLCPIDTTICEIAFSYKTRDSLYERSIFSIKQDAIQNYLTILNDKISVNPTDAKFSVENGKVTAFALSQDGFKLDIQKSIEAILSTLQNSTEQNVTITLPILAISPSITSNDADRLGITTLIGEGRTNFSGSPKNRIHNFKRAMEQFNGVIIAPQEEFSFVKHLGEVDGDHGYLPELVIKNNKTEPEFGGGICQVSSTVFRAAIYSGLKITSRRNHAYPVKYYAPYGMDATIYLPNPDLKFVNTTPGSILMQTFLEGNELVFRFYGTSDGRKTEIEGPYILERNPDGSMKTTFTQKVTDTNGNIVLNEEFKSNYKSPSLFPHPGQEPVYTSKPKDWSKDQWIAYKKAHNL